jgi:hypothetical protein
MANISEYLRLHKNEIVDLVEAKHAPEAIRGETFEALVNHLMTSLPLGRDGQIWRDQVHEELAVAIIDSMWCGWLSQAKMNRGAYTREYVDRFKQSIIQAFEIGQNYASERP